MNLDFSRKSRNYLVKISLFLLLEIAMKRPYFLTTGAKKETELLFPEEYIFFFIDLRKKYLNGINFFFKSNDSFAHPPEIKFQKNRCWGLKKALRGLNYD